MTPTDKNKTKSKTSASSKSTIKKTTSRSVGQILKKARLEKGIRLTQIVQQLNISQAYIQAIENGKINELPKEQTYTIGFVKSYAQAVDLDPEEIIEKFKQEFYAESDQYDLAENDIEAEETDSTIHNPSPNSKILWGSLGAAALAIGVWYFVSKNSFFDQEAQNDQSEAALETVAKETENLVEAEKPEEKKQAPIDYPVAQQVSTGLVREENSLTRAQQAKASPEPDAENNQQLEVEKDDVDFVYEDDKENKDDNSEMDSNSETPLSQDILNKDSDAGVEPEQKAFVSDPNKLPVLITVTEDTWIEIKDPENEDLYLSKVISPGYVYQVPKKGLVLSTGNAGATLITVENKFLPSIGKEGQVLKDVYLGVVELKDKYLR